MPYNQGKVSMPKPQLSNKPAARAIAQIENLNQRISALCRQIAALEKTLGPSEKKQHTRQYKPSDRESALLLLHLIAVRDGGREKLTTRIRLSESTLKRLWNRKRLSDDFLSGVSEWLLTAGWALFYAGSSYAAVQTSAVENWPAISSKRISKDIKAVREGRFVFDTFEHLFPIYNEDEQADDQRSGTDE
jgi:hypothetical protein